MTGSNEKRCIAVLEKLCSENFDRDEYSLTGAKESAVCLEKTSSGWSVYESERNSKNDNYLFDTVIEAGLNFLSRLCNSQMYIRLKNEFFDCLIDQKIA